MAKKKEVPYPPSPKNVPEDLTIASPKFIRQASMLVMLIFVIMLIYLGFMGLSVWGIVWAITAKAVLPAKIVVGVLCAIAFLFLIKNFIVRSSIEMEDVIEVTEGDEPIFFEFLERLCEEVGAPMPDRVYLHPNLDTAMISNVSLLHLFKPPKRALMVGMGLINVFNLSELKAVVAHELGHAAQQKFMVSYSSVALDIISSLFKGNDFMDRILERHRHRQDLGGLICTVLFWIVWTIKQSLLVIFRIIIGLNHQMSFQREYNSDLVSVAVAGSDTTVNALMRAGFGSECLGQAYTDLSDAADHRMYTSDIYYHQTTAAVYVRKNMKKAYFGDRPVLNAPNAGKKIQVFDPEKDGEVVPGDYHPSNYDREENAKNIFIPCPIDERSAWIVFENAADLRERASYKYYRKEHKVPKDVDLERPEKVQKFIDDEHAELTYDEKYHEVYDFRAIRPGDILEMEELIDKEPWDDERLLRVEERLYQGLEKRSEDFKDARKELGRLQDECQYRPKGKTKRIIDDLQDEVDEHFEWFASFDRRVYMVYSQMADRLPDKVKVKELRSRYKFHLPIIKLYIALDENFNESDAYFRAWGDLKPEQTSSDFIAELLHSLRGTRKCLKNTLKDAGELDVPMMKNYTGEESLDEFLLDENLIKEMPESPKVEWVHKMMTQVLQVLKKLKRLHFKSMGGILKLQESIAKEFRATRVAAEKKAEVEPAAVVGGGTESEEILEVIFEEEEGEETKR